MEFVKIGEVVNTFGVKGELKVRSFTDFEKDRFKKGSTIYLTEEYIPFKVNYFKHHKGFTLIQLEGLEDINLVEKYKTKSIYKSLDDIKPLPKGKYYFRDLKDLNVIQNNKVIGKVVCAEEGIRNNYIRVLKDDKEHLIPFLPNFIKNVDLDSKTIEIVDMEGLL